MKLRLAKDSVRYRIMRSELAALQAGQVLRESLQLGPDRSAVFSYSLQVADQSTPVSVHFHACALDIRISPQKLTDWSRDDQVGIYQQLTFPAASLEIVLEKDFACLDLSDAENQDTFTNPSADKLC